MDTISIFEEDLGFVRHELDVLGCMRSSGGLTSEDEIRYRSLCEKERALLEAAR